jgi:ABC-type lipoprotein export system ATPase subunit
MHCLAGRSGSGKTSLLKVAAGLMPPTSGEVSWDGTRITGLSDDAISRRRRSYLGYLDQGGVLLPGLTAVENVLLPAIPDRRAAELRPTAIALLDRLGVGHRADNRPDKLSGGERQRVAFARSLLLSPSVLMVDEPTASLDRHSADTVIALLRELTADGTAVLVSAHDPALIGAADSRTSLA